MAEMTIQLRSNPVTGKQDIVVSLRSDQESLPHEHEQLHRQLVEKLIHGGLLRPTEVGQIVVEREGDEEIPVAPATQMPQTRQAQSEG